MLSLRLCPALEVGREVLSGMHHLDSIHQYKTGNQVSCHVPDGGCPVRVLLPRGRSGILETLVIVSGFRPVCQASALPSEPWGNPPAISWDTAVLLAVMSSTQEVKALVGSRCARPWCCFALPSRRGCWRNGGGSEGGTRCGMLFTCRVYSYMGACAGLRAAAMIRRT